MKRMVFLAVLAMLAVPLMRAPDGAAQSAAPAVAQPTTRILSAPRDRVWTVTRATLESLGWKIDREDHTVGWITTKSRPVDFDEWGVYAKGTKHRLRLLLKPLGGDRTEVTVERRLWREERVLFVDVKEEEIPTTDRTVEQRILTEIARAL